MSESWKAAWNDSRSEVGTGALLQPSFHGGETGSLTSDLLESSPPGLRVAPEGPHGLGGLDRGK